jgi:L-aspartate oxidase
MKKTGADRVFIDVTHLPPQFITTRFPRIYQFCLSHGLDITRELVPVAPAAHYMMGGIKTNTWGETSITGLFATGETACTGVHGANRLASNSLLEVVVFSKRIIEKTRQRNKPRTAGINKDTSIHQLSGSRQKPKPLPKPSLAALQQLLWDKVGIIRHRESLIQAADTLSGWQKSLPPPTDRPSYELNNLVLTGRLVTEAALLREESRGAHFRTDYPRSSPRWRRHLVFTAQQAREEVAGG